jgi:hypothetical protein
VAEADDEDAGDGADTAPGGNHGAGADGDVAGARVEGRLPPSQLFVCTLDGAMQLFPTDQVGNTAPAEPYLSPIQATL